MSPLEMIEEILDILRRRWRLIARVTLLGVFAAAVFALQSPRVYQSFEVIQVEQPTVSADTVDGIGDSASARQLQQIQQRLFARETLLEIANDFGLFDDKPGLSEVERVALMRKTVTVDTVAAARQGFSDDGTISILSVQAQWSDPVMARDLAREFARRTLQLSSSQRLESAQQALDFFRLQEEALNAEINQVEDERETFRNQNALAIPGSIDSLRSDIGAINTSLLDIEQQILAKQGEIQQISAGDRTSEVAKLRAQIRIDSLNKDIDALNLKRDALVANRDKLESALARVPVVERQINDYDRRLAGLQEELSVVAGHRREAETTYALEARDQGGRLTVIETATVPEYPSSLSRKIVVLAGLVGGAMLGVGIAFLLELLHPVIRSAAQMTRRTGIVPVVTIPAIGTDHATDPGRKGRRAYRGTL
ncbi:MAG: DUF874 domain-containing protein [Maritimibacter sp.]|nr:DUF874 domain-containing protein [Maritimibacter sp.]